MFSRTPKKPEEIKTAIQPVPIAYQLKKARKGDMIVNAIQIKA